MPSLSGSSRGRARARPKGDRSRRTQREYHLQFAAGFHHRPARHGRWSTSIARCTCTPRSPTDFPAGTVDFDQGGLERNEQGHPIIAGAYVGPGNRSDRRHAAYWGEWSQINRRGLLQRAAVAIPSLSGMWSWLGPTRVWGQPDPIPASGPAIRHGRPKQAGAGSAGTSVAGSSRCGRRSPPAPTRRRAPPALRSSRT